MSSPAPFVPPRHLRNAHLQSILNSQGPRLWRAGRIQRALASEQRVLQADDGTRLLAEFDRAAAPSDRLVILLHGWEGCSRSAYMLTCTRLLLASGYDVLRVNLRDHGDSHHLNREIFNSTRSPEVASALRNQLATMAYARVFVAGFSLGASFALRIAADAGADIGIDAVVAVCPPSDPANAMRALNGGFFVYERYFFRRWRQSLQRKLAHFPDYDYAEELAGARSLDDLNRIFIPRYTDYAEVEDYFAAYALVGDRLAALPLPAYLVASEDDPIIPAADHRRIEANENLALEIHRFGGHCGFIETLAARSWIERRLLEILSRHG
ncbi:MAG: alpha/beta fold hydrolase [Gammaproteobacteria bacterium]|nr:alpha/beta fold hydrolase [Gammaproteobacteria bacterium]